MGGNRIRCDDETPADRRLLDHLAEELGRSDSCHSSYVESMLLGRYCVTALDEGHDVCRRAAAHDRGPFVVQPPQV